MTHIKLNRMPLGGDRQIVSRLKLGELGRELVTSQA